MGIIFNLFNMHSSPYLCVCGDDQMIYSPGADDLTSEPEALETGERDHMGFLKIEILMFFLCFEH